MGLGKGYIQYAYIYMYTLHKHACKLGGEIEALKWPVVPYKMRFVSFYDSVVLYMYVHVLYA